MGKLTLVEVTLKVLEILVRPEVWLTGAGPYDPITGELGKDYRALVLYKNPHLTTSCVRWDPTRELANFVPSFDWMCRLCGIPNRLMPQPSFLDMVLCPDCPSRIGACLQAVSSDLLSIRLGDDERKAVIAFCYGRCVVIIFLHFLDVAQSSLAGLSPGFRPSSPSSRSSSGPRSRESQG